MKNLPLIACLLLVSLFAGAMSAPPPTEAELRAKFRSQKIDYFECEERELLDVLKGSQFFEKAEVSLILRTEGDAKFPLITFKFAGGNAEQFLDELVAGTPIKAEFTQYALVFTPR